jgi:diguanylate cyclase (GGDEF)-like protein
MMAPKKVTNPKSGYTNSQWQKALAKSERNYRMLFENMLDGFAYCKMRYDNQDNPLDFAYLNVNQAFVRLTGLGSEVGNPVRKIIPGIRENNPELFEIYGRVAMTRVPEALEIKLSQLDRWFSISIYSPEKRYFVTVFCDITERKDHEAQIHSLAFYDALTQLPNRRLLIDRHAHAMTVSKRSGFYGAMMFLDLDNFKPLNDLYGHDVGDMLLQEVARRISSCVREMDTVARYGGDEFLVMLCELAANKTEAISQAGIIAEKIRAILNNPCALKIKRNGKNEEVIEHLCTSSIGVVLFNHQSSTEDTIRWADIAMYQAKVAGCNSIRFYDYSA